MPGQSRVPGGLHQTFFGGKMVARMLDQFVQQRASYFLALAHHHCGMEVVQRPHERLMLVVEFFHSHRVLLTPCQQRHSSFSFDILATKICIGLIANRLKGKSGRF
jgi:hypothetical protein